MNVKHYELILFDYVIDFAERAGYLIYISTCFIKF